MLNRMLFDAQIDAVLREWEAEAARVAQMTPQQLEREWAAEVPRLLAEWEREVPGLLRKWEAEGRAIAKQWGF